MSTNVAVLQISESEVFTCLTQTLEDALDPLDLIKVIRIAKRTAEITT